MMPPALAVKNTDNGAPPAWLQKLLLKNMETGRKISDSGDLKTLSRLQTSHKCYFPINCLQQTLSVYSSSLQGRHYTVSADPFPSKSEMRHHLQKSTASGTKAERRTFSSITSSSSYSNQLNSCSTWVSESPQLHRYPSPLTTHGILASQQLTLAHALITHLTF